MKHIALIALALASATLPALPASKPYPESCSIGDRPFVHPLEFVSFNFDGAVELGTDPVAYVTGADDTMTVLCTATRFEVSNYTGKKRTQGTLNVYFDRQLLPLGKDYRLFIGEGTVVSGCDPSLTGFPVEIPFSVPSDLGDICSTYPNIPFAPDIRIGWLSSLCVFWAYETEPVGNPEWTLYRNGEPEGTWPVEVGWDWDLGQARIDFGGEKHFERDARYTLVLPAGSVSSLYRDDLVNREVRLDFTGDYEDPGEKPLMYSWCSLWYDHSDVIGKVWFRYDVPIIVSEGAKVQLYEIEPVKLVAEADAFFDSSINCYNVCADFGGYELEQKGYTFVMPEGAVTSYDGKTKCERQTFDIPNTAGIKAAAETPGSDSAPLYDLFGRRVEHPVSGTIYIRNGNKIVWK